ncbi:pentapeptide repeat-containing protein [Gordonia hankookensis]|uniref:Pentapeptide repeat-containing protein n=3 Tax=Gordonia hankookensis TaxID=589403 RepID=A0ABR7WGN9_9ACTN|nr:pentapeptide repeat-containing protein [Gordonia hankookensis]
MASIAIQYRLDNLRSERDEARADGQRVQADRLEGQRAEQAERLENLRFVRERAGGFGAKPFSYMDLQQMNLSGLQLPAADLTGANLSNAQMNNANITGGDLVKIVAKNASMDSVILAGAKLDGGALNSATLRWANLSCPTSLPGDAFVEMKCNGTDARGPTSLDAADLTRVVATDAEFEGVRFWGAKMSQIDLRGALLKFSNLASADLSGALIGCIDDPTEKNPRVRTVPRCANLTGARLTGVDLRGADLRRAVLTGTVMDGDTDLREANLHQTVLSNICYESATKWPSRFVPPPARVLRCYTDASLAAAVGVVADAVRSGNAPEEFVAPDCLSLLGDPVQRGQIVAALREPPTVHLLSTRTNVGTDSRGVRRLGGLVLRHGTVSTAPLDDHERWLWSQTEYRWLYDNC